MRVLEIRRARLPSIAGKLKAVWRKNAKVYIEFPRAAISLSESHNVADSSRLHREQGISANGALDKTQDRFIVCSYSLQISIGLDFAR